MCNVQVYPIWGFLAGNLNLFQKTVADEVITSAQSIQAAQDAPGAKFESFGEPLYQISTAEPVDS